MASAIHSRERAARTDLSVLLKRVAPFVFREEAGADAANLLLCLAQGLRARVNGVVAERELVAMERRATEHEHRIHFREKIDPLLGRLEDRQLAAANGR